MNKGFGAEVYWNNNHAIKCKKNNCEFEVKLSFEFPSGFKVKAIEDALHSISSHS